MVRTTVWGYCGNRLKPIALPGGRVCWERKERHDGFTVEEGGRGVFCAKELDVGSGEWGEEKVLHSGSYLYRARGGDGGDLWIVHRPILQDETHQLVIEKLRPAEARASGYAWLEPRCYTPLVMPVSTKRERLAERPATERDGRELRLYWGDTHVHSSLSIDPEGEPDELLHYARDLARLDFVALTDNDSLYTAWLRRFDRYRTLELAEAWSSPGEFAALDGFEYTRPDMADSHRNHRTVLTRGRRADLFRWSDPVDEQDRERVSGPNYRNTDGLGAAAERIGALLICHHANWVVSDSTAETGIEAVSGWDAYMHNAEPFREVWNSGKRLCLIGGSDGHRRNAGLGGALTGVWAEELSDDGILDGIAARRTVATQGRRLSIEFRLKDERGGCLFIGDYGLLSGTITACISIRVEPGWGDRIELVELLHRERVLGNWGSCDTTAEGTRFDVEYELQRFDSIAADAVFRLTEPRYLYLRVRQSGPDLGFPSNVAPARGPWAWTTPIWWREE